MFIKNCKCGKSPKMDTCIVLPQHFWISCECGREGKSNMNQAVAISNWDQDYLKYTREYCSDNEPIRFKEVTRKL